MLGTIRPNFFIVITVPIDIVFTPKFLQRPLLHQKLENSGCLLFLKWSRNRENIFQRPTYLSNLAICFSVCLDVYKIGEAMRILPCSHRFHKACIDQWLLDKRTCPMCKMDILKHYGLIGDSDMMNFEERDESLLNLT